MKSSGRVIQLHSKTTATYNCGLDEIQANEYLATSQTFSQFSILFRLFAHPPPLASEALCLDEGAFLLLFSKYHRWIFQIRLLHNPPISQSTKSGMLNASKWSCTYVDTWPLTHSSLLRNYQKLLSFVADWLVEGNYHFKSWIGGEASSVIPDLGPFIGGPFPTTLHQIWNTKTLEPPHSRPVKSTTCCNDIPATLSNTLPRFPTIMAACGVKIGHRESTMEVLYFDGGVLDVLRVGNSSYPLATPSPFSSSPNNLISNSIFSQQFAHILGLRICWVSKHGRPRTAGWIIYSRYS